MSTFSLRIYTAEKIFFEGACESLIVPTEQGQYGILAHHTDLVLALCEGEIKYRLPRQTDFMLAAVSRGIVTVENNVVTVLCLVAETAEEIDFPRATKQYEHAKKMLAESKTPTAQHLAQAKLARAVNRLKTKTHK